ncbi:MAG: electron transport complex subunit RsxE [Lachnospiraceae bacterium]|nr:electron transport complex subunit RsxE [Lachnospiraceae bacterium]
MSALSERLLNGMYKENPTLVLMLGMCPTLAVTTSAVNGLGMGVSTMLVLAMSNLLISLLRKIIPDKIRIPAFIVIIASFVTIVELLMKGYIPSLYSALGLYIPLIVVNCIILGRAESYAYSHPALLSLFDGLGMGMGFTFALTLIGALREILGSGKVFGTYIMPEGFVPVSIFVMAPGAFFVLALLTAIQNKVKEIGEKHGKDMSKIQSGCGNNCLECDKVCKVALTETAVETAESEDTVEDTESVEGSDLSLEETGSTEVSSSETDAAEPQEKEEDKANVRVKKSFSFAKLQKGFKERFKGKSEKSEEKGEEKQEEPDKEPDVPSEVHERQESEVPGEEPEEKREEHKDMWQDAVGEPSETVEELRADSEETDRVEEEPVTIEKEPETQQSESDEKPEEPAGEPAKPEISESSDLGSDDELELWDISDFKKAMKRDLPSGKRPGKKKKAMEKAREMLNKADDAAKEESND